MTRWFRSARALSLLADQHYPDGDGNRKPDHYLVAYETILGGLRREPLRILEIGIYDGHSIAMWLDFFPKALIVGFDIRECPAGLISAARYRHVQGNQDSEPQLEQAGRTGGPYDIIIDDASHIGWLTQSAMFYLFPRWLKPGGQYIIEDFGTGLRPEFPDADATFKIAPPEREAKKFRCHDHGLTGFVKQPIDHMMLKSKYNDPDALAISDIHLFPSIGFFRKKCV